MAESRPLAAAVLALAFSLLPAQLPGSPKQDDRAELDRLRTEIRRLKGRLDSVRKETRSVETELRELDLELAILDRELDATLTVQAGLDRHRAEIIGRVASLSADLQRRKLELSRRLAALYRLGNVPYLRLLLALDPGTDPLQGASMLAYLIGKDSRAVSEFQRTQDRLVQEEERLSDKEAEIARTQALAEDRRQAAASKQREKQAILARLEAESASSERKLAELEEKARRLERLFTLLYQQRAPAIAGAKIAEFKGALQWPIEGSVSEEFGRHRSTRFGTYVVSNGIRITAEPGTEVRAVFSGTVLYAQWFRGYGNLIIVDHGERVFSLYGNTKESTLAVGDRVNAAQVIARVSEDEEAESGSLYFEIREDNRPANPRDWLR
ncbi:MAG TPA: peptidoglycan DD-metalloendopeptidase family protein [Thermoanaerobaculia bacterium]|nr:peptidoglycan DD-metalloendopeptidase family protein [Thermoanaerobaculia bacterium]